MKSLFSEIPHLCSSRITVGEITMQHAQGLYELAHSQEVYRYLPTFLYEQQHPDIGYVVRHLYDECWKDSILLGVFAKGDFCGLAEFYGYRAEYHKVSVGYRLLQRWWGKGIASETLDLMLRYLYGETDIEIITASTMVENQASARVLTRNGFDLVTHGALEDWGYPEPTVVDKWIR
ncbi:MAG: GNAT family N-acetyltransferase [Oscillospiraceae bacterium]|nr:GNAT family N-acetyltransferase [Oscillospiraceae bacterium]